MLHGSIVALVTPMAENGDVDLTSLSKLIDWHLASGTHALVILGTTGESPTIEFAERKAIIQQVVAQVAKQVPVIVGTGSNCTRKTIELTEQAQQLGADACLIVTPYYNKPVQEGLYQHYYTVAKTVPIPQILYNVPGRTGCDLQTETVARLADVPNIIGIKEGNVERVKDILAHCTEPFEVYSADDATALAIMQLGGKGIISVTANVAPKAMREFCEAALAGNDKIALELNEQLLGLHKNLFLESNPIPVKWALEKLGWIAGGIRLPLTPLAERYQPEVYAAMQQAGIL